MSKAIMTHMYALVLAGVAGIVCTQQVQPSPAQVPGKEVAAVPETQVKNTNVSDDRIQEMVKRSVFLPRVNKKKPEPKVETKPPEKKKEPPPPTVYSITGVFRMPDGKYQLLVEKNGGGESSWISNGGEFKGVKVVEIALEGTKVAVAGAEKILHVGDEFFREVPQDESAAPKQPETNPPQQTVVATQTPPPEQKVEAALPEQKTDKTEKIDKAEKKMKKKMKFSEED